MPAGFEIANRDERGPCARTDPAVILGERRLPLVSPTKIAAVSEPREIAAGFEEVVPGIVHWRVRDDRIGGFTIYHPLEAGAEWNGYRLTSGGDWEPIPGQAHGPPPNCDHPVARFGIGIEQPGRN